MYAGMGLSGHFTAALCILLYSEPVKVRVPLPKQSKPLPGPEVSHAIQMYVCVHQYAPEHCLRTFLLEVYIALISTAYSLHWLASHLLLSSTVQRDSPECIIGD